MPLYRILLVFVAFTLSAIGCELLVSRVLGFPSYGIETKVRYRKGGGTFTNIRKPYSKMYSVEGKTVTSYNNLGLPGVDVSQNQDFIAVLGSSYVEALQHKPELIASSIFQEYLHQNNISKSVINLGCSGHDPYDSWFRLKYYEQYLGFRTDDVILVLNSSNKEWFERHLKPLDFTLPQYFGKEDTRMISRMTIFLRNISSIVEAFARAFKEGGREEETEVGVNTLPAGSKHSVGKYTLSDELKACISAFSKEYSGFRVISIASGSAFNNALADYCSTAGVPFTAEHLLKPDNQINKAGHLNEKGNRLLGELMYLSYRATP